MGNKKRLKIILAGQKKFAADLLDTIIKLPWVEIIGVIPDKGDTKLTRRSKELGIKNYNLKGALPDFDLGLTAHFFSKIPDMLLKQAKIGWLGYHPSLLPLYRGKKSVAQQIENKEKIVGGTLFWLSNKYDEGEIYRQEFVFSNYNEPLELWINELAPLGLKLFINALFDIKNGKVVKQKQKEL